MGKNNNNPYHQISFFNPTYCLQPLTSKELPQKCSKESMSFSSGRHHLTLPSCEIGNNPSSPKVGCMGQIKKDKVSWPWTNPLTTRSSSNGSKKFLKLGRVFSSRNMISPRVSSEKMEHEAYPVNTLASVHDMDPPLPVVKYVMKEGNPGDSLWKRRRGDQNGLEGLQINSNGRCSMSVFTADSCGS